MNLGGGGGGGDMQMPAGTSEVAPAVAVSAEGSVYTMGCCPFGLHTTLIQLQLHYSRQGDPSCTPCV